MCDHEQQFDCLKPLKHCKLRPRRQDAIPTPNPPDSQKIAGFMHFVSNNGRAARVDIGRRRWRSVDAIDAWRRRAPPARLIAYAVRRDRRRFQSILALNL